MGLNNATPPAIHPCLVTGFWPTSGDYVQELAKCERILRTFCVEGLPVEEEVSTDPNNPTTAPKKKRKVYRKVPPKVIQVRLPPRSLSSLCPFPSLRMPCRVAERSRARPSYRLEELITIVAVISSCSSQSHRKPKESSSLLRSDPESPLLLELEAVA